MKKTITLKKNYEFRKVLTKGKYYSGKYLDIYVSKHHKAENRIGMAIGVKIANAVKRNHIKRLIRENYRVLEEEMQTGYTLLFLWKKKKDVSYATFNNIKEDMLEIFKKIGILS